MLGDENTEMVTMWGEMEVRSKKQGVTQTKQRNIRKQLDVQHIEVNVTRMEREDTQRKHEDARTEL